ncbi:MAG TPA: SpoIIE family protein phosphatase [Humisphaera sp.]
MPSSVPTPATAPLTARVPSAAAPLLEVRDPQGAVRRIDLSAVGPPPLVVGRSPDVQVRLDSLSVSRRHVELTPDGLGGWRVRDLDSKNGTQVDGVPLTGERPLPPGSVVLLGGFELRLVPAVAAADGVGLLAPTAGPAVVSDEPVDHVETLGQMEPPRVAAAHLTALSDLSRELLETPEPADRAGAMCRAMARPPFHGHWAAIVRLAAGEDGAEPQPLVVCQAGAPHGRVGRETAYVSRSLIRAVSRTGDAALASNVPGPGGTGADAPPENIEISMAAHILALAAVACPLRTAATAQPDLLYVTLPPRYATGEWLALAALAAKQYEQAEVAWAARRRAEAHAALEKELARARSIQQGLVPRAAALARVQGAELELAVGFVPSQHVAGDYVDALRTKDGRVLAALADVCGHGMAAALVASSIHTLAHASVRAGLGLGGTADNLNQHLCETLPGDAFATMAAASIDPQTGGVEFVNAGHPPPLVAAPDGTVRRIGGGDLEPSNLPLGLDDAPMVVGQDRLGPGDMLVLYSDGLTEATDTAGTMLGLQGMSDLIGRLYRDRATAQDVAAGLQAEFDRRRAGRPPADDLSFVLVRRLG